MRPVNYLARSPIEIKLGSHVLAKRDQRYWLIGRIIAERLDEEGATADVMGNNRPGKSLLKLTPEDRVYLIPTEALEPFLKGDLNESSLFEMFNPDRLEDERVLAETKDIVSQYRDMVARYQTE